MLEMFEEGKVYEVLLLTKSNLTPVGVVRRGDKLYFKLFGGKSAREIKEHPYAVIQITQDVELLVKSALNFPVEVEFEMAKKIPLKRVKGLPAIEGRVEWSEEEWSDELGCVRVLKCSLTPIYQELFPLPIRPLSRADYALLEMAVYLTRLFVATRKNKVELARNIYGEIWKRYQQYRRFGGKNELAEKIIGLSFISMRWNT
ncbi:hypothetical protein PAP_05505 [Palaeococcus pacificus DY20341]|uniref:DUF447 domain-containing protein n=1 Tax=Palaeococcus pacificus DY20341 TaxID=1343739 RepID=A0A075LT73_9EURY|nr:DUF447 domain-containing protein [Palaeococcus pacificus]AIF69504.1 hypothetical protein PAP_05505 [Palaeococcus pacificus DY20341]